MCSLGFRGGFGWCSSDVRLRGRLRGLRGLFGLTVGSDNCHELRAQEIDVALEAIDVVAHAIKRMAGAVPYDKQSNCQSDDQKEFHKQLLGL